jgi:phosphoadenosine phosphosulfate reductase
MEALKNNTQDALVVDPVQLSAELVNLRAGQRLELLYDRLGSRLVASTSFGLQAAVMLKLIHDHAPKIPIVSIDTGFLFPETYRYAEELMEKFPLDYRIYQPTLSAARIQALWGNLWENGKEGADRYALLTKVEPMNRALREIGGDVWISGLRRSHSDTRQDRPFAEQQKRTLKVYPILDCFSINTNFPVIHSPNKATSLWAIGTAPNPPKMAPPTAPASTARSLSADCIWSRIPRISRFEGSHSLQYL